MMTGSLETDFTDHDDSANQNSSVYGIISPYVKIYGGEVPTSPYLNHNFLYSKPTYIFSDEQSKRRGRFEVVFCDVGTSVAVGSLLGGGSGILQAMRDTAWKNYSARLKLTTLTNHVIKNGRNLSNTFGIIGVYYSTFAVSFQMVRDKEDDWNNLLSGLCTGIIYCSGSSLSKCLIAGCVGLGLSSLYCLRRRWLEEDE